MKKTKKTVSVKDSKKATELERKGWKIVYSKRGTITLRK